MKNPYSQGAIALTIPCRACSHKHGLIIIRYENDPGFVRCGGCDAPQYSISDRKTEVSA